MDNLTAYLNLIIENAESVTAKAGWFPTAVYPNGETVASVALQNEVGDPSKHIPPRPFMRVAIANNQRKWAENLAKMIQQGMGINDSLELTAIDMASDIQDAIRQVTSPELSKRTIAGRISRIASGHARAGGNIEKPLIDTGYMYATCIGVVEDKEA